MKDLNDYILPRIASLPPSGIRKYFDMINEMEDVISLSVGEPDFITPWAIIEAGIYSLEKGQTSYSANAGYIELRREISRYLEDRFGLLYNEKDEILVTVGGSEAIDIALRSLVDKGDEVIIPEPSFVAYKGCTVFTGATPVTIELTNENHFKLTVEQLEKAVTPKTKVLILGYPNNPTGATMTREDYIPIVEYLKDKDIIVLSDEIYAELTYSGNHVSIASFPELKDRVIIVSGFSKAFAMTGWRIGYVCAHKTFLTAMNRIHQYAIMCSPTTAQKAAIEALRNQRKEAFKMAGEYNQRRRVILEGFRKAGLDCFEPQGAFYVFPDITSTGLTSEAFCDKLLMEEKVLCVPGTAFGQCGEGFIRATYANSLENIALSVTRIKHFVKKLKQ